MGIETRNGRAYYYRKRRIGRRVVSQYVAGGNIAGLLAQADEQDRADRRAKRAKEQAERQRQANADAMVEQAAKAIRATVAAELSAAGHHRHKGQWRKKHHASTDQS